MGATGRRSGSPGRRVLQGAAGTAARPQGRSGAAGFPGPNGRSARRATPEPACTSTGSVASEDRSSGDGRRGRRLHRHVDRRSLRLGRDVVHQHGAGAGPAGATGCHGIGRAAGTAGSGPGPAGPAGADGGLAGYEIVTGAAFGDRPSTTSTCPGVRRSCPAGEASRSAAALHRRRSGAVRSSFDRVRAPTAGGAGLGRAPSSISGRRRTALTPYAICAGAA